MVVRGLDTAADTSALCWVVGTTAAEGCIIAGDNSEDGRGEEVMGRARDEGGEGKVGCR